MADNIVGQIALELGVNSDNFKKQLENLGKITEKSTQSITNFFSITLSKIEAGIAAAFSVSKIVEFGKASIESAASVNALNSQFEQTFGNMQAQAEQALQTVAKNSGIVQSRLQGVGTSIYAFAKTTGMDSASAMSLMSEALQVTADSAAYYDRSLEDTAESLKSFLKGNFENDAALGLSCIETTRNAAANKLYGKSFIELSESQKQLTLLQMVKDANALSGAMGQAARESDGWENVIGNLKETWNQFLAVVGQPILQVAVTVIKQITLAIQTLTSYAKMASNALGELFGWNSNNSISASISSATDSTNALLSSTSDTTDNLNASTEAAEKLKKTVAGFDQLNILKTNTSESTAGNSTAIDISSTVSSVSPATNLKSDENAYDEFGENVKKVFEKISNAIEPVKKSLGRLKEQFDRLGKFAWEDLKNFYNDFLKPVGNWVLGEGLPRFIDAISQMMSNVNWKKINNALDDLWKVIEPFAVNVGEGLLWFFEDVLTPFGSWTMNNVVSVFLDMLSGALEALNGVIEKGKIFFQWLWDNFLKPIAEWTGGIIVSVLQGIETALQGIANNDEAITTLTIIGTEIAAAFAIGNIVNFVKSLHIAEVVTKAFSKTQAVLNGIMNANPISIIIVAVAGLVTAIILLWDNCEWFRDGWTQVWEWICNIAETVWNAITSFFTSAWEAIVSIWNGAGDFFKGIWDGICSTFNSIGAWFSNTFTNAWNGICTAWNATGEFFSGVWDGICNAFSSTVSWLGDTFSKAWDGIKNIWNGVGSFFSGIWDGIKNAFSAVTNWFGDTFSKAWSAVKNVFSMGGQIFDGIKDGILSAFKFVVNGIIDGLNWVIAQPFNGINNALKTIKYLDFWGWKPFEWINEIPVPQIPKLARGGLVTAPTLALVGDNRNAQSDPEVVAPLSRLKGMISEEYQTGSNSEVLAMLKRIYDVLSNQETQYTNVVYLDSEEIERKLVKIRKRKSRRYGGVTT